MSLATPCVRIERACKVRDNLGADFVDQILIIISILYSTAGYNLEYNMLASYWNYRLNPNGSSMTVKP